MNTLHQIKTILTPVRLYSVEDFMKIAEIVTEDDLGEDANDGAAFLNHQDAVCIRLMSRYEEMTRGKWVRMEKMEKHLKISEEDGRIFQPALLTKEMFVCEVEKPNDGIDGNDGHGCVTEQDLAHEAAKKKVWFEGFEQENNVMIYQSKDALIYFMNGDFSINTQWYANATVHDFIAELDRYNRTATTPIHITPTDSFVEALINDKN